MRRLVPFVFLLLALGASPALAAQRVGLSGHLTGAVHSSRPMPDVATSHQLTGAGTTNLGATTLSGSLAGTGFIQHGHCGGTLTLTSARGTLVLAVTSGELPAFSPCPSALSWAITRGTGSLKGSTGSGTLHVTLGTNRFTLVFDGPGSRMPALASTGLDIRATALALLLVVTAAGGFRAVRAGSTARR